MSFLEDEEAEPDFLFKLVLIGDSGVGKSNLLLRWAKNQFNPESAPTIGLEFATKTLKIDGKTVKVNVWDTAGQEQFRALMSAYYRGAVGALLVYDITSASSFTSLEHWISEVRDSASPDITCLLIGNKSDLADMRCVTTDEGIDFGRERRMTFMETSAKDGFHTDEAFETLIRAIVKKVAAKSVKNQPDSETINGKGIVLCAKEEPERPPKPTNECCS